MKNVIVIPTYNEKENITKLIAAIFALKLRNTDILVVDDNSPDGTSDAVKKITKPNTSQNHIFILDRTKKEGLGKAYVAGFKWALANGYDKMVSMDADFSHDPKYLPKMLEKSNEFDVVIGSRYTRGGKITGWQWHRYLNSWGAVFFTRLILGLKPKDVTAGYKCYSRKFLAKIDLNNIVSSGYAFQVEMINLAQEGGFKIAEIPITFADRRVGQSKISGELRRSVKAVFELAKRKKFYRQFVKFGIVGVGGTLIDLVIYNILALLFHYNIYFARTISFILAATNNYILNRRWTFKNKDKNIAKQYFQFFFISAIGLGLNLLIMHFAQNLVKNVQNEILKLNIPVVIAILIVLVWNFFANKYWTFKDKK